MREGLDKALQPADMRKLSYVGTTVHACATPLLQTGSNLRFVRELLEHKSVETAMLYTHVIKEKETGIKSPLHF